MCKNALKHILQATLWCIKMEFDDILHYQKIIVALIETDSLMKEIKNRN